MPNENGTYRITRQMVDAGVNALDLCRRAGGHTPQTVAQAVFAAMLDASDVHPGAVLRKAFEWSLSERRTAAVTGSRPPRPVRPSPPAPRQKRLTRADFDANGVRRTLRPDGTERIQVISDFWYLKEK